MDGPGINQKIRYGYAKAAEKLGQTFSLYRSTIPVDPISPPNLVGSMKAVVTIDWEWMKSNKPGNAIWWLVVDGQSSSAPLSAQEGDYLVGDATYFVLTKEYQMPMSCVQCNRVVSVFRADQSQAVGNIGYTSYPASGEIEIFRNMPCSVLKGSKGSNADSKLPTDTLEPEWGVLIPNLDDRDIITGDFMVDESGSRYVLSVNEKTQFGWRLTGRQVTNG